MILSFIAGGSCAGICGAKIDYHIEIGSKLKKRTDPFPIVDWRPGSLAKFKRSTGFRSIPSPKLVDTNNVSIEILSDIDHIFSNFDSGRCVSVAGTIPLLSNEYLLWTRALEVNKKIKRAVREMKNSVFGGRQYLVIHWRFEESKARVWEKGLDPEDAV